MFNLDNCAWPGCKNKKVESSRLCRDHMKGSYREEIISYLKSNDVIRDLMAPGIHFENLDLREKHFINCYFHHTQWDNCQFDNSRFQMVFFDDSVLSGTSMEKVDMINCIFTESVLFESSWRGSDLVSVNWNRIKCQKCDFSESDLYYSRFIAASLKDVKFIDCNLKRVDFCLSRLKRVTMKYSNVEEAYFQTEKRE